MDKFNFLEVVKRLEAAKSPLMVKLANQAQRHFVATFDKQGFDGKNWQEVKRRMPGTPEYKYPRSKGLSRQTSPILVRTGTLRKLVNKSVKAVTPHSILLTVAAPYAKYLNDGTGKMVRRRFMGDNAILRKEQKEKMYAELERIWQG